MASYQARQRDPLLDQGTQAALERRGKELLGAGLIAAGVLAALVLGTYSPEDPSWMAVSSGEVHNALGRVGAMIASPLMGILGVAAWLLPLCLIVWGGRFVLHRGEERWGGRTVFVPIALLAAAATGALTAPDADWSAAFGMGGRLGDMIAGSLLGVAPVGGAGGLKILAGLMGLVTLGASLFVTGFTRDELRRAGRWTARGLVSLYVLCLGLAGQGAQAGLAAARLAQARLSAQRAQAMERAAEAAAWARQQAVWAAEAQARSRAARAPLAPHAVSQGAARRTTEMAAPAGWDSAADPQEWDEADLLVSADEDEPRYRPAPAAGPARGMVSRVRRAAEPRWTEPAEDGFAAPEPELYEQAWDGAAVAEPSEDRIRARIADAVRARASQPAPPMSAPMPGALVAERLAPAPAPAPVSAPAAVMAAVARRLALGPKPKPKAEPARRAEPPVVAQPRFMPRPAVPAAAPAVQGAAGAAHPGSAAGESFANWPESWPETRPELRSGLRADPRGGPSPAAPAVPVPAVPAPAMPAAPAAAIRTFADWDDAAPARDGWAQEAAGPAAFAAAPDEAIPVFDIDGQALSLQDGFEPFEIDGWDEIGPLCAPEDLPEPPGAAPRPALSRQVIAPHPRPGSAAAPAAAPAPALAAARPAAPAPVVPAYETPPLDLLSDPATILRHQLSDEALEENARMLESVLDDYGVKGEIVSVRPGPVVTMYELEPAPGLKASRVIGLSDDIARSMSALSARVSTVPGRSVIGIELPNQHREKVVLREILSARDFGDANMRLPLALGKDIAGEPIVANLAKMPHLLIAGTTGSGKSVAINTMILSLLYKLSPEECRLIMIDPKMLELSVYDGIPHLLSPVVTDPKKAVVALKWVVGEMEERYRRMSKMGVRNIEGYNGRVKEALARGESFRRTVQTGFDEETGEPIFETDEFLPDAIPYIVVIVDEMADLMMVAGKEIEACIQRLAQMARASGIHLIMATQRPSVDVITGTIKANFPTRISFQVTSKIDSRTILGEQGAEQLLGMGDMLYMGTGARITRIHGPFVSDEEVEEIVTHLKSFGPPSYMSGVVEGPDDERAEDIDAVLGLGAGGSAGGEDALYDQAVAIVARDRKCSTSYIQRKLGIGYNKAARLVEQMEVEGVVSPANHVGKREILVPEA